MNTMKYAKFRYDTVAMETGLMNESVNVLNRRDENEVARLYVISAHLFKINVLLASPSRIARLVCTACSLSSRTTHHM